MTTTSETSADSADPQTIQMRNDRMFPERRQIISEAFAYISENRTVRLDALYQHIMAYFEMTDEEIARKDSQGASLIKHEVRWALQTLKNEGRIVRGPDTGVWMIT